MTLRYSVTLSDSVTQWLCNSVTQGLRDTTRLHFLGLPPHTSPYHWCWIAVANAFSLCDATFAIWIPHLPLVASIEDILLPFLGLWEEGQGAADLGPQPLVVS